MAEAILSRTQRDDGLIFVRRSMVQRDDKNNILAVQMHNGSDFMIDGVDLRVEFLDRPGGTVKEAKEFYINGLMGLSGEDFILPDISMATSCEAANVKIYAVTSGDYYYRISDDGKSIESEVVSAGKHSAEGGASDTRGGGGKKIRAAYALFAAFLFILSLAVAFAFTASDVFSDAGAGVEIVREIGEQDV